jgi:serine/threonine protein kinase
MTDTGHQPPGSSGTVNHVALAVGCKIGRYEILDVLGQGGFGITYRARDLQLSREVAIKEYLPTALAIRQGASTVLPRSTDVANDFVWGRDRFIVEGRTLASLHEAPAIVRVFDFLEENGTAYIVMELLRGETLESKLRRHGPQSFAEIDAILWPLLDGLQHVHAAGFLHRDIKPANILLNAAGRPTLIDFGASRAAMAGRTAAMTAIFTPGYAAAEQFTSAKQGPWTDIYGLSATLYCAITGRPPPSAFDRMLDDAYEPLVRLQPQRFPRGLLVAIDTGLAVRAADRPQSIAAWRPILEGGLASGDAATVLTSRPQPVAVQTGRKARAGIYIGAAVAVLALTAGGYFALAPEPARQATALQDMKVEDLEKALEARRRADAEAADKRRIEEEAQRKAEADAAAKRAADAELEKAQAERQKAEEELARLKTELEAQRKAALEQKQQSDAAARQAAAEEAQRKAEVEAAARRQAEEEARRKAAAEAEAKRQADDALAKAQAERQRADEEAARRAEAEAKQKAGADAQTQAEAEGRAKADAEARGKAETEAKAKADAEAKKAAEIAEAGLKLGLVDRQRIQVALTSLGFDTRGNDGALGQRSREMIAGWQKARSLPPTGFLNAAQQQALLREATASLGKYDEEQKKLEELRKLEEDKKKADEAKRKADEEAKTRASPPPAAGPVPPVVAAPGGGFDGTYSGGLSQNAGGGGGGGKVYTVILTIAGGRGTGQAVSQMCGALQISVTVSPTGQIGGPFRINEPGPVCSIVDASIVGRISGDRLEFDVRGAGVAARGALTKRGG